MPPLKYKQICFDMVEKKPIGAMFKAIDIYSDFPKTIKHIPPTVREITLWLLNCPYCQFVYHDNEEPNKGNVYKRIEPLRCPSCSEPLSDIDGHKWCKFCRKEVKE